MPKKKQSQRARREALRRAKQRRQRMTWGGVLAVVLLGVGALVLFLPDSADKAPDFAPDFELFSMEGETVRLSDYRGQPVAVTFMHTW